MSDMKNCRAAEQSAIDGRAEHGAVIASEVSKKLDDAQRAAANLKEMRDADNAKKIEECRESNEQFFRAASDAVRKKELRRVKRETEKRNEAVRRANEKMR